MNSNELKRRELIKAGGLLLAGASFTRSLPLAAMTASASALSYEEYVKYDAMGLAELVARGEVSPAELLATAIARAEQVNPIINAINLPHYDFARKSIAQGLPKGPLHGVPWLLKDLYMQLQGTRTTNGSVFFKDNVAQHNSTLVDRYRQAGLVIFGKTHSPEFGGTATTESRLWGDSRNPWNLEHTTGGSSGGSAAAVAAGILPAANASDGGGSIRIPASCCGLFGMKPTRARVPMGPDKFEGSNGQSVLHAVTRSVRDSALILDLTRGPEPGMPYHAPAVERPYMEEVSREPGKLRIALMPNPVLPLPVHEECLKAVNNAAALCEKLGHDVEEAGVQIPVEEYFNAVGVISSVGTLNRVLAREKALGRKVTEADLEPLIFQRMEQGRSVTGLQYAQARDTYHKVGAILGRFHQQYDVILNPTMANPPLKIGAMSLAQDYDSYARSVIGASVFTQLFNVTGQPSMSVPLHWSADGLPVGVMFTARFGDEGTLFRLASQLEQASPWFDRMPSI